MPKKPAQLIILSLLCFFVLTLLYFVSRLINLTSLPVFVDEAIYIRWAQVMKSEPTLRFLPMSDGKQPLFMWLMMPAFKLFSDPLFAGRFISVLAGFGSMIGLLVLTFLLTSSLYLSILVSFLYILTPFTLFFDRQALVDSLLSMFGIWSVIFGFLTIKFARLDLSLFLGFVLGGAMLTKSPALVFVGLLPLLLIFYTSPSKNQLSSIDKYLQQRLNPHVVKLAKLSFLYVVALVLAVVMYNILRLGPNFSMAGSRNFDYVFPLSEVFTHPFNPLIGNLKNTFSWYLNFVTPPILILGFLSVLYPRKKIVILLALFVVLPLLMQGFIAKVYTTRYFLYTVPYFLILASLGITSIKRFKPLQIGAVLFVLASTLYYNYFLWFDVTKAPLPQQMAHGYFQEWTAGFGQKEVADYLKSKPKDTKILVGTEGFFGSLPDGLQIFTEGRPNIVVVGLGHPVFSVSEKLTNALIDNEVYLVVNKSRDLIPVSERGRLHLVAEYEKPPRPDGTREVLEFFQVK